MHKLLLTIVPIISIGCTAPPKPPAISGVLEPVNKHRAVVTANEKLQSQTPPLPQAKELP